MQYNTEHLVMNKINLLLSPNTIKCNSICLLCWLVFVNSLQPDIILEEGISIAKIPCDFSPVRKLLARIFN